MAKVGAYVERYYATTQRVMALETVTIQPLRADLSSSGFGQRYEYDLRIEWTPGDAGSAGSARTQRTLLKVNGRPPKLTDEPGCFDAVSPEPLAMFLPDQRTNYGFTLFRPGRVDKRRAMQVDYRSLQQGPVVTSWRDDCVNIDAPGRTAGRVWVDEDTGEVLRVDEHLVGRYDIPVPPERRDKWPAPLMTIERSSSSIRYKPVRFTDPDETVLMPAEIVAVTVSRDVGASHVRFRHVFTNYRRFVAEGRILED